MSQQGGRPARRDDDWWGQLYDESADDTGPTAAPDSLDDRFASARNTVSAPSEDAGPGAGEGSVRVPLPGQRGDGDAALGSAGREEGGGVVEAGPGSDGDSVGGSGHDAGADPGLGPDVASKATLGFDPIPGQRTDPELGPDAEPDPRQGRDAAAEPGLGLDPDDPEAGPTTDPAPPEPRTGPRPAFPPMPGWPAPASAPPGTAPPEPPAKSGHAPRPQPPEADPGTIRPGTQGHRPDPEPGRSPEPVTAETPQAPPSEPSPTSSGTVHLGVPASTPEPDPSDDPPRRPAPTVTYVGTRPPTYDPEPVALPAADPDALADLVSDTVLDGARYGTCTLRAASLRGDSARYRGEPRRDAMLTARFGSGEHALVLVAMATGARAAPKAHRAAAEACRWIAGAVGRSHERLAEDVRAGRKGALKSGLHRLTDRGIGMLRASAAEQELDPELYTASLRCLLLSADPDCRNRVFFGTGDGGLFRLRRGEWQDVEPSPPAAGTEADTHTGDPFGALPAATLEGDRITLDLGLPAPPSSFAPAPAADPRPAFRFRASVARPGDVLLMCTGGLAEPLRGEPALGAFLARRWSRAAAPGLAAFLADTQTRVKGYADDRTAAAVWEA
ncbi:protein phosphatase 2C domain-containing protein [Streptomyces sp. NPDC005004]